MRYNIVYDSESNRWAVIRNDLDDAFHEWHVLAWLPDKEIAEAAMRGFDQ